MRVVAPMSTTVGQSSEQSSKSNRKIRCSLSKDEGSRRESPRTKFWLDGYVLKWREIGDIAAQINDDEEDEEEDNDDDEDAAKVPPTHTVALETLTTFSSIPHVKDLFHGLMNLKKLFLKIHENKEQSSIINYFVRE
ncbi:hypothetical protein AVEN_82295-1 [Araneus ventricosus]|uniref:Uncharacterized protein n=1 Tax=Araneus ventricosus TaxID=182803 RepID=A0A4Y2PG22_ARAVE|nr:hypothetical protein AVEN_82295-1 [Araneus ventricosus]